MKKHGNQNRIFKQDKVCEICGTSENLTVHNHKLPRTFWLVFCRNCHDKVDGIIREGDKMTFLKYEREEEKWYDKEQGWYEGCEDEIHKITKVKNNIKEEE